jgi:hypothetical protein
MMYLGYLGHESSVLIIDKMRATSQWFNGIGKTDCFIYTYINQPLRQKAVTGS